MSVIALTPDRMQHMVNLARDGCRSEIEREFVGAMAEAFSEMFGQQAQKINEENQAKFQAEIDARIAAEVKEREEMIRKELEAEFQKKDATKSPNGVAKT